jgi:hypothetical protein
MKANDLIFTVAPRTGSLRNLAVLEQFVLAHLYPVLAISQAKPMERRDCPVGPRGLNRSRGKGWLNQASASS